MSHISETGERVDQLSSSQRMLLALDEAVRKLEAVEYSKTEPIAIVGLSCRFPGGANDPETFWQLLINGVDAITEVPPDRWHLDTFYDPNPDTPGKMSTRYGGFLQHVDQFEPQFFGISPREAIKIDPQQRLLLEVSWEALENAGLVPNQQATNQTGVFVGITTNDYAQLLMPTGDRSQIDAYYLTGNPLNAVAGRLSYTLGLQGPCMAIDTACSSSLVAVHLACQSLRNGECTQALAGGVNLILSPENTIALSKARMMAPDGRCKTFDAEADGIVRGEGCGVLVLKRLSDAIADRNNILALIRGSAVNQDGSSSGFTVPNKAAQETLIRQALTRAKVEPSEVDYVEAHGTGTSLGDPIEVRALGAVLGQGRTAEHPLKIGSVKTNIGHLESAAGVASLIKVVLSLQHQQIPPHLHLKRPSSYINWDELPVCVTTEPVSWPAERKQRIAGVSSFGASGTNAHIVLEEAPALAETAVEIQRPWHLLTLSAKSEQALQELVRRYGSFLASHPDLSLADICLSANTGRSPFEHRLAVIAPSTMQACQQLEAFTRETPVAGLVRGQVLNSQRQKMAFLFTGQGSQYVGMGRQLYNTQLIFRAALDHCEEILRPELDRPLLEILYPPEVNSLSLSALDETAYTQPALFAVEYALYQLWQSWGIQPDVVLGHSVGEYVAACVAGVFSLEAGLKLIAARGRLMQALPQAGEMVAVLADPAQVTAAVEPYKQQIAIAAINGPRSLVISGERQAVRSVCAVLTAQGVKTKSLQVSHAFHSPLMQPMLSDFQQVAAEVAYSRPQIKLIANLTGQLVSQEIATPEYWCQHILSPVQFASSLETLRQQGYEVFVEIGPKPTLLSMGRHCLPEAGQLWLPSLRPGQDDWQQMLESLAQLWVRGIAADWHSFERDYSHRRVVLPTNPWQRQRYWVETVNVDHDQTLHSARNGTSQKIRHPLLGRRLPLAGSEEIRFESHISRRSPVFLEHHQIYQAAILPATAYLEIALAAGAAVFKSDSLVLEEVVIQQALMLSEDEYKTLQLVLQPEETAYSFQVFSLAVDDTESASWTLHASGKVRAGDPQSDLTQIDLPGLQAQCGEAISGEVFYGGLRDRGFDYGPNFQGIKHIWKQEGETLGQIQLPAALIGETENYQLHPVLLDACVQVLGTHFPERQQQDVYLPVGVERLQIYCRAGTHLWSQIKGLQVKGANQQHLTADLHLLDQAGSVVAKLEGISFRRVTHKAFRRAIQKDLQQNLQKDLGQWLYQIAWQPKVLSHQSSHRRQPGSWLIFADNSGVGLTLAQRMQEQGEHCVIVSAGPVYKQLQEAHYQINLSKPEDFQRLLQESLGQHHTPCHGIVHLWSIDAVLAAETNLNAVQEAQVKGCGSVLHLVQALTQVKWSEGSRLCLVTRGVQPVGSELTPLQVQQSSLWGLGRVIALEHPELHCVRLDLDPLTGQDEIPNLIAELSASDGEDQVAYRRGVRHVARLVRHQSQVPEAEQQVSVDEPFQLQISNYGILENLTLSPMTRRSPGLGEVEIQVCAVGLNFRDVLNALGMLKEYTEQMGIAAATELPFGGECAGRIVAVGENVSQFRIGDEVIAAQTIGSLASFVNVRAEFVVPKPRQLSFEAAATIPTAFLTAYYGLHRKANLRSGDRVLIHAAAGGVGQAAVQLAQRAGAEVLATASPVKWDWLQSTGVKQVMNSRSLEFAEQVMDSTSGQGVDIVLNSLNGEFIPKSLEALGAGGRFVEIGKIGIWDQIQVQASRPDVAYFPFDLLDLSLQDPSLITSMLEELMEEFKQGSLKPLPHKVFPIHEVVSAFRYMAQSRHIGKVVITIPERSTGNDSNPKELVRENGSYLITGGLGALGLKVARWMVDQGAKHLVLTGRGGASDTIQQEVSQLEQSAQVLIVKADISDQKDVSRLLETVKDSMPSLRGIVHAAGVLEDGMLLGQRWDGFNRVMAPKVLGAWNLHALTQDLTLDFFVCFSSVSALLGSPGQGNYAAANAFMDTLVRHRRALGLPGVSINWGPWGAAGMAAALSSREQARWVAQGVKTIAPDQGLQVLKQVLEQDIAQVGVLPVDWSKFLGQFPHDLEVPFLEEFVSAQIPSQKSELRQQLETASAGDRQTLLITHVRSQIARVLGLNSAESIDPQQGFSDLGMDSLMAVELSSRLQTSLECSFPVSIAFDYPTVAALVDYIVQEVLSNESASEPIAERNSEEPGMAEANLDHLSDSEAEALLLSKLDNMRY